jgi:hypothetical protein
MSWRDVGLESAAYCGRGVDRVGRPLLERPLIAEVDLREVLADQVGLLQRRAALHGGYVHGEYCEVEHGDVRAEGLVLRPPDSVLEGAQIVAAAQAVEQRELRSSVVV